MTEEDDEAMLDVHPPHHALSTWRDFLLHILTITIGLLIAIGLEQSVEALHHRHLRRETRNSLREEISDNRSILASDLQSLDGEQKMLLTDIDILRRLGAHQPPAARLRFNWQWSSMQDAAWQTARENTTVSLFPTAQVQAYSTTYTQQSLANAAGIELSREITDASIPLTIQPDLTQLSQPQIDELIRSCAVALNQIDYTRTLTNSLDPDYTDVLRAF